jgi:uncharacterized BrkB/YihY/UPF0761 family membrane protein
VGIAHREPGRPTFVARLRQQRVDVQRRLEAARTSTPGVDTMFVAVGRDRAVAGNLLACAIAFRLFLWLLPMTLALTAGMGLVEASGSGRAGRLADSALGGSVVSAVSSAAEQAEKSRWILLVIAVIGLYSAGTAGARTVVAVHELAWGMPRERRRAGPLSSLGFTAATLSILAVSVGAQYARRIGGPGFEIGAAVAIGAAYAALWLGLSTLLPHADAPWRALLPGAVVFGIGSQLLHVLTVLFLAGKIASASELYGGLGVAATLLLGLYMLARVVVATALVNAAYWRREPRGDEITRPG